MDVFEIQVLFEDDVLEDKDCTIHHETCTESDHLLKYTLTLLLTI